MGQEQSAKFLNDAARLALISKDQDLIRGFKVREEGPTRQRISSDLGGGMSTLNKWITLHPLSGKERRANHEAAHPGAAASRRWWRRQRSALTPGVERLKLSAPLMGVAWA